MEYSLNKEPNILCFSFDSQSYFALLFMLSKVLSVVLYLSPVCEINLSQLGHLKKLAVRVQLATLDLPCRQWKE